VIFSGIPLGIPIPRGGGMPLRFGRTNPGGRSSPSQRRRRSGSSSAMRAHGRSSPRVRAPVVAVTGVHLPRAHPRRRWRSAASTTTVEGPHAPHPPQSPSTASSAPPAPAALLPSARALLLASALLLKYSSLILASQLRFSRVVESWRSAPFRAWLTRAWRFSASTLALSAHLSSVGVPSSCWEGCREPLAPSRVPLLSSWSSSLS
jgi:hypothetical protein